MSKQKRNPFDWGLLFLWMVATTMGWFLGQAILPGVAVIITGFGIGILQWLALQGRFPKTWHWIVASGLGWAAGWLISYLGLPQEVEILAGMVFGASMGAAQWLILRHQVHWSGWWIVASIVGWTTGLTLLPGILLTGIMGGLISGIALEILLRFPLARPDSKEKSRAPWGKPEV
jgi:hypothetical protein